MQLLDMKSGFYGSNVVALAEDDHHSMWVVTDHGISSVTAQKDEDNGRWTFAVRSYNDRDGLQPGPFNQRAICFTRSGYLLVGGQDGLDIINTRRLNESGNNEKPIFSGLVIFNDEIETGSVYNGRVILENRGQYLKRNLPEYF
jgi:ligand-binding sensor domain-containing protein